MLTFVDESCALFADDGDDDMSSFTHAQYGVWHQFKDIVDSCISAVLSDLGGSEEAFAEACENILKEKDKGPRDAAVKDVLRKLLTYDSFESFGYMMKVRCQELDGRVPSDANYFEEANGGSIAGVKLSEDAGTIQRRETKTSTVEEDEVEGLRRQLQLKEWEIQLEIAKSIISTSKSGEDSAGREPELIEWAQGVLEMERLLLPTSGASAAEISAFRRSLTILRNKVDLMVARKMLEENDQLRRKLEKDREEQEKRLANGGDYVEQRGVLEKGERGLESLLDQHVEKQADAETQRQICVCYFQDQRVSQESYSEVYFFLKDMVRQENCSFMLEQDEVHDFIFNRLGHEEMTLVPEMLKLLVLEDEEAWLQAHIRSIVSGEPLSLKQQVVQSSSPRSNSTVPDQGTGLQASRALEEAQSVAKRERIEREITEAKMSEVQAESQRVHQELLQQVANADRIAEEKFNAELQTRIDAEVRIRMEAVERERGEERRKLEQERAQIAEETKNLDRRLQRIEEQRIAAEKKEAEIQALQKKAHEVTRAALQKNKELKVLDEHVQQKLKEEAEVAAIRERSLEEEEVRLARLKKERQAEEEFLKKRQHEQLKRQEMLNLEIEVKRKQENDQREEATERLQKEFDLQARDHVENQRKEVERMKEKLAKRLEKKKRRKTRTKSGELDDGKISTSSTLEAGEDVQDAELKSTLTKARVEELAAALQDQLANTHARKAGADEGKCQEVRVSSNSAAPSLLGDLPALKGAQYTRKSESVIEGKMASGVSANNIQHLSSICSNIQKNEPMSSVGILFLLSMCVYWFLKPKSSLLSRQRSQGHPLSQQAQKNTICFLISGPMPMDLFGVA